MKDEYECENHYNEIYPPELILKNENTSHTETTFLDFHLCITESQIQTSLYDKSNSMSWDFHINVALYHQKYFLQPLVQKYFESVEQLPLWHNLLEHLKLFYIECWDKGQIL